MLNNRLIIVLALMLPFTASAQEGSGEAADTGSWTYIALKHSFNQRLTSTAHLELRTKENCSTTDVWFFRLYNRYKILPWLTGELNLESNNANLENGIWRNSFRIHLGGIAALRLGDFALSTMQREYFFVVSNVEPASTHFLLSQIRVGYAPEEWRFSPYLSAFWLFRPDLFQRRLIAGTGIRVSESLSLNLYYMFKTSYPSGKNTHVAGLGLTIGI